MTGGPDDAPFDVLFAPPATKELGRLRADDAARLRRAILSLAFEPRPQGVLRVAGTPYLRLRVGDLRVIYLLMEAERRVVITRVAKRSEHTYRRL